MQGRNIIGDVTESLHRFIIDGWTDVGRPIPRIEEDLSFVPKDREEVVYVYLYRVAENTSLQNAKKWREAKVSVPTRENSGEATVYYARPPLYLDLYYLISVHAKFRSEAERLIGWLLLRLHEASHLVYRPRRYTLPDQREVDSLSRPWQVDATGEDLVMEKVALSMVDDLTVGDAINFYTIHEAPFRPYLTYQARCAMEGSLIAAPGPTTVRALPLERLADEAPPHERPGGRLGRMETRPRRKPVIGPEGHDLRPLEENNESED